ncbi:TipAS antibiotic-recognition domain-containing protein [uncultured Ruminococcus sp.]|uniref:TipAS antibiotic-recognition domain-containing protein n=1 Tax=uncultured Ruminococcus sp. TaxID=165186 RepID=UPI00292EC1F1|nr:TipAS antibiotic-recognition domain-containing protein [uncultured Ruminococcus sp.]
MNNEYETIRDQYAQEAKQLWGNTEAYKENERRMADYTQEDWNILRSGMDNLLESFAKLNARGVDPDHEKPYLLVKKLQMFIDTHMYHCTDEILAGLGEMYVSDERFTKNIDKHGEGTAAYISACIKSYCADK